MAERSDSKEELLLTQSCFNGSSNRGNELEKFVSSNNRQVDHENAQVNVEEATEGLFSFDHSVEHQEVSICSLEKETKANKKKASKRDIIVVDDKELLAKNSECNVFSLSKGATSEYPATICISSQCFRTRKTHKKKNLVICKLVAGYSEV